MKLHVLLYMINHYYIIIYYILLLLYIACPIIMSYYTLYQIVLFLSQTDLFDINKLKRFLKAQCYLMFGNILPSIPLKLYTLKTYGDLEKNCIGTYSVISYVFFVIRNRISKCYCVRILVKQIENKRCHWK